MFDRYAIFYTPAPGAFADFCAAWLGWDSRQGVSVPHPQIGDLDISRLTDTPRKYGFHGTLKAPFRLVDGATECGLRDAVAAFATDARPVALMDMTLQLHRGFVALRPTGDVADLNRLAAEIVTQLDGFRAAPTATDLARRRASGLTDRQDHNLITWGYPYVMDDFHFHLTLTGPVDAETGNQVLRALTPLIDAAAPAPFLIDQITLMGQASDGMFHEIHRYALTG